MARTSKTAACESFKGSTPALMLLLWLLLIAPVLARPVLSSPRDFAMSTEASLASKGRDLLAEASPQSTMKKLHPEESTTTTTSFTSTASTANETAERQFQAAAHDVPSGPNPESNK